MTVHLWFHGVSTTSIFVLPWLTFVSKWMVLKFNLDGHQ